MGHCSPNGSSVPWTNHDAWPVPTTNKPEHIVDLFHCREVYVYAMGQEPWLNYIMSIKYTAESRPIVESNRLIQSCQELGIIAERLFGEKEILLGKSGHRRPMVTTPVAVQS